MKTKTSLLCFPKKADLSYSKQDVYTLMRDYVALTLKSQACEAPSCRLGALLNLSFNFATHLLRAEDELDLWATVLVSVTAAEGLGFNRAFIFQKSEVSEEFVGQVGLGPTSAEAAAEIWRALADERPPFEEMVARVREEISAGTSPIQRLTKELRLCSGKTLDLERFVTEEHCMVLRAGESRELALLFEKLGVEEIALAALHTPPQLYGLLVVDNFVTKEPITEEDLQFLETMAALASMAFHRLRVCHELDQQKHLLVEAERLAAIGQLSSKVFHEIRNPISAIGGLSKLLLKKDVPEEIQAYLRTILKEAERLERVLEDLFEFIRPITLKREPVRLFSILQTALSLLHSEFRKSGVHVTLEGQEKDPLVLVDRDEMLLVFIHLIKNALEAMPHGGTLSIRIENHSGVRVRIVDSGCGIPQAYLQRVTEPFFTTKTYGSGLGLSVAKKIVELHGGTLVLRQIEPTGTEVEIYLPPEAVVNGESV